MAPIITKLKNGIILVSAGYTWECQDCKKKFISNKDIEFNGCADSTIDIRFSHNCCDNQEPGLCFPVIPNDVDPCSVCEGDIEHCPNGNPHQCGKWLKFHKHK